MNDQMKETLNMTAQSIGKDLLTCLVQELRLLPDVWVKISQAKQDDIIERLRKRVDTNVRMAVHLVASEGRTVVAGDLESITIKDGVKAVCKFSQHAPNLHEMFDAAGKAILLVVANPTDHTGGMDEVKGESDQRAMDLGKEYAPNSDGEGMEGEVVDAEFTEAPQLGYEEPSPGEQDVIPTMDGILPNEHGVYLNFIPNQSVHFEAKKVDLHWDLLQLENGTWIYSSEIQIEDLYISTPMTAKEVYATPEHIMLKVGNWIETELANATFDFLSQKDLTRLFSLRDDLLSASSELATTDQDETDTAEA